MQAGPPVLESRRAVRGGATATKAASASTSTHAAAPAQQHRRARLRAHISMHTMARTNMACMHSRALRHAKGVTPAAPTSSLAATSAPCCSSVCTTAACPREEAKCKLVSPTFWRTGVRSAAGPQRQERPRQAATPSRAGHPSLRTRTSASTATLQVHIFKSRQ